MNTAIQIARLCSAIICAALVMYFFQAAQDGPLVAYAAVAALVVLLSVGKLICELWEIRVDSPFYRYLALPGYPLVVIVAVAIYFHGISIRSVSWLLAMFVLYLVIVLVDQLNWITFIGKLYKSHVSDRLLFPAGRQVSSREDLVLTELIINGVGCFCILYIVFRVLSRSP